MKPFASPESIAGLEPGPAPRPEPQRDPEPDAVSVAQTVAELGSILSGHRRAWAMRCQARGMSMMHFGVVSLLDGEGPLPMSRLAELLDITYPNASGVIARLEERGIVAREHAREDRRVVLARITDDGRTLLAELEADRIAALTRLVEAMTSAERLAVHRSAIAFRAAKERLHLTHSAPDHHQEPA